MCVVLDLYLPERKGKNDALYICSTSSFVLIWNVVHIGTRLSQGRSIEFTWSPIVKSFCERAFILVATEYLISPASNPDLTRERTLVSFRFEITCMYVIMHACIYVFMSLTLASLYALYVNWGVSYQRYNLIDSEKHMHLNRLRPVDDRPHFLIIN